MVKKKITSKQKPTKKTLEPEKIDESSKILEKEMHDVRTELQISLLKWKIDSIKKNPKLDF